MVELRMVSSSSIVEAGDTISSSLPAAASYFIIGVGAPPPNLPPLYPTFSSSFVAILLWLKILERGVLMCAPKLSSRGIKYPLANRRITFPPPRNHVEKFSRCIYR
uniref:Uncharacterized protein n=1 Tax=Pseudo-nitzschia delicatissima TaxID=44447 RepID=A0A7S0TCL0_9STRA